MSQISVTYMNVQVHYGQVHYGQFFEKGTLFKGKKALLLASIGRDVVGESVFLTAGCSGRCFLPNQCLDGTPKSHTSPLERHGDTHDQL